jgi:hypothetical protein
MALDTVENRGNTTYGFLILDAGSIGIGMRTRLSQFSRAWLSKQLL